MSTITRFRGAALTPFDWGNLPWFSLLAPSIRTEEYVEGNRYTLRAELPGVDPAEDVHITCVDGELRLDVVRKESHTDKGRSEFHYGSFSRAVTLPPGVDEDTIAARYADGILEITAVVGDPQGVSKQIPITIGNGKGGNGKKP